jgi:hypothetical protein
LRTAQAKGLVDSIITNGWVQLYTQCLSSYERGDSTNRKIVIQAGLSINVGTHLKNNQHKKGFRHSSSDRELSSNPSIAKRKKKKKSYKQIIE